MNIYQVIDLLKTTFTADETLTGVNILIDATKKIETPAVLIEAERTIPDLAANKYIKFQTHELSLTVLETAQNTDFSTYKNAVNVLVKKVVTSIYTIDNPNLKFEPVEFTHSEVMIDSKKATAVIITLKVLTKWND